MTPTKYFSYRNNKLHAEEVPVSRLAKKFGTPLYVYSKTAFLEPLQELHGSLAAIPHLVCYAVKANSNLSILSALRKAGAGMDLVSGGELYRAKLAGADPEKTVFSGVGKTSDEIAMALTFGRKGIFSFNVESEEELQAIEAVAKKLKRKARVAFRFNPDVDAKTHPYISTGLIKNKFGMARKDVLETCQRYKNSRHLQICGLSIHIGSQLLSLAPLKDAYSRTAAMVKSVEEILPNPLNHIDLGGGVGVQYFDETPPTIKEYTQAILDFYSKLDTKKSDIKILMEPGRLIAANSGILVTEILYKKNNLARNFLVVDAAMNDLMRPALYGSHHQIIPEILAHKTGETIDHVVVGPVCESSDTFSTNTPLSAQIPRGALLALLSSGAYGFSMASTYNSRPLCAEVLVSGKTSRLIRSRQNYSDLVAEERKFLK